MSRLELRLGYGVSPMGPGVAEGGFGIVEQRRRMRIAFSHTKRVRYGSASAPSFGGAERARERRDDSPETAGPRRLAGPMCGRIPLSGICRNAYAPFITEYQYLGVD